MNNNCYDKSMEMIYNLQQMQDLMNKKEKATNINEIALLDKQIEDYEIKFHEIKHSLQQIEYR